MTNEEYIQLLDKVDPENWKHFQTALIKGMELLDLDDDAASRLFDVSRPSVTRWKADKARCHVIIRKIAIKELRRKTEYKLGK